MTVIVLNFHYRGPVKKVIPKWFKTLLDSKIGKRWLSNSQAVRYLMNHSRYSSKVIHNYFSWTSSTFTKQLLFVFRAFYMY